MLAAGCCCCCCCCTAHEMDGAAREVVVCTRAENQYFRLWDKQHGERGVCLVTGMECVQVEAITRARAPARTIRSALTFTIGVRLVGGRPQHKQHAHAVFLCVLVHNARSLGRARERSHVVTRCNLCCALVQRYRRICVIQICKLIVAHA